jgi:hypothetical protein
VGYLLCESMAHFRVILWIHGCSIFCWLQYLKNIRYICYYLCLTVHHLLWYFVDSTMAAAKGKRVYLTCVSAIKLFVGFGVDDHLIRELMRFIEMTCR